MEYRQDKYGNAISQLGYGCMRFTRKGAGLDYEAAKGELLLALEKGINYFDTAYLYPGSEELLGRFFEEQGNRETIHIATKLPQYLVKKPEQIEGFFKEELGRLKTDYVDYYLMHMMTDVADGERLKGFGIEAWIKEKKESGAVRNIGFSYHGATEGFLKILNSYDWDFCQIQYNYLDENSQAGRKGLEAAQAKGIPVVIMEPLRGGKLVKLPKEAMALLNGKYTPAELGLRWLWDQPGVTCVLSGMNTLEMVEENTRIASEAKAGAFTEEDFALVEKVKAIIRKNEKVGCTGCRYCMPCPKGVDIPSALYHYNQAQIDGKMKARVEYAQNTGLRKDPCFPSQCVGCGACEKHCPQGLPIREKLKEADACLRPLPIKIGVQIARKILHK